MESPTPRFTALAKPCYDFAMTYIHLFSYDAEDLLATLASKLGELRAKPFDVFDMTMKECLLHRDEYIRIRLSQIQTFGDEARKIKDKLESPREADQQRLAKRGPVPSLEALAVVSKACMAASAFLIDDMKITSLAKSNMVPTRKPDSSSVARAPPHTAQNSGDSLPKLDQTIGHEAVPSGKLPESEHHRESSSPGPSAVTEQAVGNQAGPVSMLAASNVKGSPSSFGQAVDHQAGLGSTLPASSMTGISSIPSQAVDHQAHPVSMPLASSETESSSAKGQVVGDQTVPFSMPPASHLTGSFQTFKQASDYQTGPVSMLATSNITGSLSTSNPAGLGSTIPAPRCEGANSGTQYPPLYGQAVGHQTDSDSMLSAPQGQPMDNVQSKSLLLGQTVELMDQRWDTEKAPGEQQMDSAKQPLPGYFETHIDHW